MIFFPITQLEIKTSLTSWEVESVLREEMGKKRLKSYDGEIKHSGFEFGCRRYLKVPVSIVYGKIENQESGSILIVSIRPAYIQFIFPVIVLVMAFSRITTNPSLFFQFFILSVLLIGLLMIGYKFSVKKDIEFINRIFTSGNNQNAS